MTQGPACSTVAGRTSPFLPSIPSTAIFALPHHARPDSGRRHCRWIVRAPAPGLRRLALLVFLAKSLDLDVHARGQIELHERVHRLLCRLENVEQALMGANLKLLARLFVHVRRT